MVIAFFAWNVLCEPRAPEAPHLRRVEAAKIHRLPDIAIGFSPWFADFEDLDRRELIASAFHDCRGAFKQERPLFK